VELIILGTEALLLSMKLIFTMNAFAEHQDKFSGIWLQRKLYIFFALIAALFLILYLYLKMQFVMFQYIDIIGTFTLISIVDYRFKLIPNSLLICFLAGQLLYSSLNVTVADLMKNAVVGLVIFGILALGSLLLKGRLGMGDAKLIGLLIIFTGWRYALQISFWGMIAAFIFSIALLLMKKVNMKSELPFVPFLTLGMILHFIFSIY
jgi:prepilin signal peptidase PulO-like enzyme (type II secretory pathway)